MKNVILSLFVLILSACSATLLIPTQADVDRVGSKYSGYTLDELNKGKAIFETNCNKCHGLKSPTSRNEKKWTKIVPKMVKNVKRISGKNKLDEKSQELLLKYLITMSLVPSTK